MLRVCLPGLLHLQVCRSRLLHELVDGLVHFLHCLGVVFIERFHDAMLQMFLQQQSARTGQGRPDRRELDQHVGAVIAVFDHPLDLLQMPDRAGQPVDDRPDLFRIMGMRMRPMGVLAAVLVGVYRSVRMDMLMRMRMIMCVAVLCGRFLIVRHICPLM